MDQAVDELIEAVFTGDPRFYGEADLVKDGFFKEVLIRQSQLCPERQN